MHIQFNKTGEILSLIGAVLLANAQAFAEEGPALNTARIGPVCATADDGRFLVAGGHGPDFKALASMEIGSPESGNFSEIALPDTFDWGAIARLQDGRYLFAGSAKDLGVAPGLKSAYIFDPSDNTVSSTGSMTYARMNCSGATLADGRVLVVGGWYNATSPVYGDLYDPGTGSFTATGPLSTERSIPIVLPADDSRAVVIGGSGAYGGDVAESVEIYDPEENSFTTLRPELVEGDPGWKAVSAAKEVNDMRLADGRYAFRVYKPGTPTQYGIGLFDPDTLACTVHVIPGEKIEGYYITASGFAVDGENIYIMLQKMVGSGPATTVRIAGYHVPSGPDQMAVGEPVDLNYTPFYPACTIREGRFFSAGATDSTGSRSNFGALATTLFASVPEAGPPSYDGWFYIHSSWMYWAEGERWIYSFNRGWAYDFKLGEYFKFGEP